MHTFCDLLRHCAGGHYVPNLAAALLDAQREGSLPLSANGQPVINLQGFLVGNAWTDPEIDNHGGSLAQETI